MLGATIETTERALTWVRWSTLIILFLLSLVWRVSDRAGIATWILILSFTLYNGGIEVLREYVPALHHYQRAALIDLPLVAILYFFAAYDNGAIFVLYLLVVFCATTTMPLRMALQFTALAGGTLVLITLLHPYRLVTQLNPYVVIVQIILVVFWGISIALLKRQVLDHQATAHRSTQEVVRLTSQGEARLQFMASVAHDLRTPLTASRAGLGMLAANSADRLTPAEQHLLDNVRRNMERLRVLTDDLLAFNLLESGAFHLEREPVDLSAIIRAAAENLTPLFAGKEQTCTLHIPLSLPYQGSQPQLEQTLTNLLVNANKHTPIGTQITVDATQRSADIHIAIRDTGPGLPADAVETIFHPFQRAATSASGSGLGLTIARSIVTLHGGNLWAENCPDGGARFHITLNHEGNS